MNTPSTPVNITDINISFGRLVVLLLKIMLASIPAVLVLYTMIAIFAVIVMLVFGMSNGLLDHLGQTMRLPNPGS